MKCELCFGVATTIINHVTHSGYSDVGLSPPAPIGAPCNSMSPLFESIKCYFMPK